MIVWIYLQHNESDWLLPFPPLEMRPVVHQCQTLCAAMVHFINQLQYYITFEVCCAII